MTDSAREKTTAAQLADAYMNDLELALRNVSEAERQDTIMSVHQRLSEALADPGTVEGVRQVIDEIGSVEDIASMCTPAAPPQAPAPSRLPLLLAFVALAMTLWMPYISVPLAIGTLIAGISQLRRDPMRGARLTIWISTASLLIVAVLMLLLL